MDMEGSSESFLPAVDNIPLECTCLICGEIFGEDDHRGIVFSCGHTIGRECSLSLSSCPTCSMPCNPFRAPPNYMLDNYLLLTKSFMEEIPLPKKKQKVESEEKKHEVLEVCSHNSNHPAERYCLDCDLLFCSKCDKSTHKSKKLSEHKRRIDAQTKPKLASNICPLHENEITELFCTHCDVPVCESCVNSKEGKHFEHQFDKFESLVEKYRNELDDHVNSALKVLKSSYEELNRCKILSREKIKEIWKDLEMKRKSCKELEAIYIEERVQFSEFEEQFLKDLITLEQLECHPMKYFFASQKIKSELSEQLKRASDINNRVKSHLCILNPESDLKSQVLQ